MSSEGGIQVESLKGWLRGLGVGHITQAEFAKTYTLAAEVSKIPGGLKAAIKK